ncbi:DoxX family protein [Hymenobacter terricola]|uniref:DoxX family protein n=1 Tax=Hymenobacter terricola TaxID=2819236 RepID=UPI001B30220C|nr:DoxX family protein [Hymenobacter terricola]
MKATNILYWATTGLIGLMMTYSAYAYLTAPAMQQAFHHLGFPDYFRVELAVAKLLGVVLLLAPMAPRLKEWAYAGFAFVFVSAVIAHTASGDPVGVRAAPSVFLVLLVVSYVTYHRRTAQLA